MIRMPVFDFTGTAKVPVTMVTLEPGRQLRPSDIRAIALNALRIPDEPNLVVEVRDSEGELVRGNADKQAPIDGSCVLCVRKANAMEEIMGTFDELRKSSEALFGGFPKRT